VLAQYRLSAVEVNESSRRMTSPSRNEVRRSESPILTSASETVEVREQGSEGRPKALRPRTTKSWLQLLSLAELYARYLRRGTQIHAGLLIQFLGASLLLPGKFPEKSLDLDAPDLLSSSFIHRRKYSKIQVFCFEYFARKPFGINILRWGPP
jgi:hypothetical protein